MRTLLPLLLAATLLTGCTGMGWLRPAPDESEDVAGPRIVAVVENAGDAPVDVALTLLQSGQAVDGATFRAAAGATEERTMPFPNEAGHTLHMVYTVDGAGRASSGANDVDLDPASCPGGAIVVTYRIESSADGVASSARSECRPT